MFEAIAQSFYKVLQIKWFCFNLLMGMRISTLLNFILVEGDSLTPFYGSDVSYTCKAIGGDPTPSLRWMFNGREVSPSSVVRRRGELTLK